MRQPLTSFLLSHNGWAKKPGKKRWPSSSTTFFTRSLNTKPPDGKVLSVDELNQHAISKILGSQMTPVKRGRFGNFGLLETTVEALRAGQSSHPSRATVS